MPTDLRFIDDLLTNCHNAAILARWQHLELEHGWLVAGCLFQTVWNLKSGLPPASHIKDYDLFYFDDTDLSETAERQVQSRVKAALADLPITVEVVNQARVHLWYEAHFGHPYPRLRNARDGIDRFLVRATCVGVRPTGSGVAVYAPNGLRPLYEGRLTPNPLTPHRALFEAKARSYAERWPWLTLDTV